MAVHIYQNNELNDVMYETTSLEEWKQLASEMGMDNQLEFVRKADTPIPYPNINASMHIIFDTLCPMHVDLKEYRKTPIPLEVMQQIVQSVRDKHFTRIQIWYDDKAVDPLAVGITEKFYAFNSDYNHMKGDDGKDLLFDSPAEAKAYAELIGFLYYNTSYTNREEYAIARWGDVLRPDTELKKLAADRLLEKYGAELKIEIENSTQALKKLQDNVTKYLSGELSENELKGKSRW
jgi:hypothetical protein